MLTIESNNRITIEINSSKLGNTRWVGCWTCGNALIQGETYSYVYRLNVPTKPWDPEIHKSSYAICCSEECLNLAFIALM